MKTIALYAWGVLFAIAAAAIAIGFWHDEQTLAERRAQEQREKADSAKIHAMFDAAFNKQHPECVDYKINPHLPDYCY